MNDDLQVTVTLTAEDLAFYDQAKAAGIPSMLVSMYSGALQRLVASAVEAEREACAQVCDEYVVPVSIAGAHPDYLIGKQMAFQQSARAIRARGEK